MARPAFGLFVGFVLLATPVWGGLWRWTDGAGNVHKARSVEQIPPEFRERATEIPDAPRAPTPQSSDTVLAPVSDGSGLTVSSARSAGPSSASDLVDKDGHDREWWTLQVVEARARVLEDERKIHELRNIIAHGIIARVEKKARKALRLVNEKLEADRRVLTEELPKRARTAGAPRWWLDVK